MQKHKLNKINNLYSSFASKFFALPLFLFVFVVSSAAWAQDGGGSGGTGGGGDPTVGDTIVNFIDSAYGLPGLIAGVSYLVGLVFGVLAILKMRDHVTAPTQTPLSDPVKYLLTGGALFALPMISDVLHTTITGGDASAFGYSGFNGSTSGGGLDAMLVSLIRDIWAPMHGLVAAFGYLAGLVLMMIGVLRLVKSSQDGARGPGGFGTIMTFLTAGALFSLDQLMGVFTFSIFGDPGSATNAVMSYAESGGLSDVEAGHVHAVISAIVGFVVIVGWLSFLRGWFILRGVAEGDQQASVMAATTHIVAGALCANIGGVLNAIQETLQLVGVGVVFT